MSLQSHIEVLKDRHASLETRIAAEDQRPRPDSDALARLKLENWLYWICADSVTTYMFASQGYPFSAGLFISYMIIAVFGYREWLRKYRLQSV